MKNKKEVIISTIGILSILLLTLGISLAFFNYAKEGLKENAITTGSITFLYTEVSEVGNGININDAFPKSDEKGKVQIGEGEYFDFRVEATLSRSDIEYEVVAEPTKESVLPLDAIKFYLTDTTNVTEEEISTSIDSEGKVKTLNQYNDTEIKDKKGKTIYQETILRNTKNYVKNFRARMWIAEDISWNNSDYVGKSTTIKINVYANSNRSMASTTTTTPKDTSIERVTANNMYLFEKVEEQEYNYTLTVPPETENLDITVTPSNMNATAEVEELDSLATASNIKRLSTVSNLGLEPGENYFKALVTSSDKTKTEEYILKVVREIDTDNTLIKLEVDGYSLNPIFDKDVTNYTLSLEASSIEVNAETTSKVATVTGIGTKELSWGENEIDVIVTAQDGTIRTYKIIVNNLRPTAPVITGGNNEWTSTPTTITLSQPGGAISEVKEYEYYKSTSSTAPTDETEAIGTTTKDVTITDEGITYIWYRTVSNNEFKSEWSNSQTVKLDTNKPEMDVEIYADSGKVYADVYIDDELSGIDKISSNTGITKAINPNYDDFNIYISTYQNSGSLKLTDERNYSEILNKYINVTKGYALPADISIYDLIIINWEVWGPTYDSYSYIFDEGINLITISNDGLSNKFIDSIVGLSEISNVYQNVNNILSSKLNLAGYSFTDSQKGIKFSPGTIVPYKGIGSDGNTYDIIGIHKGKNAQWIHVGIALGDNLMNQNLPHLVDYIYRTNGAQFEISTTGNYTFYGYDKAGNIIEKTVYIDTTAPTTPIFSNKVITDETVTLTYTSTDDESEIIDARCYYGDSESTINQKGTESNGTCIYPPTAEYAKVCVKNASGLESCSANKQLATYFIKNGQMLVNFTTNDATNVIINQATEYVDLQINRSNRSGMYTTTTYDMSKYNYGFIDSAWSMTANSLGSNPSIGLVITNNGNFINNTGTTSIVAMHLATSGNYDASISTARKTYGGIIDLSGYNNSTIMVTKNASNVTYNIDIYNIWFQLKD